MSPISLLLVLVAAVLAAAEPPLRDSLVSRLSLVSHGLPVSPEPSESGHSSKSFEESNEHVDPVILPRLNPPLVRAPSDYRYNPTVKQPRHPLAVAHHAHRPRVIQHPAHHKSQTNRYDFCAIALSGQQNHAKHAQVDVEPTIIPPKKDVELVYGNYCDGQRTDGNKLLGMQVIACDLGGKEKPYVIEQLHNDDPVKNNHFDVYGTPDGVVVFAKQFCGYRIG